MKVSEIHDTRGKDVISMVIELEGDGVAALMLEAQVTRPCEHGRLWKRSISGEIACNWELGGVDLDDLEAAIRGNDERAKALAWRTLEQVLEHEADPCGGDPE